MSNENPELIQFNGMPAVHLRSKDGSEATVLLHGAHIVSWKPCGGDERLYLSEKSVFADGVPVRGGVPIIFPQFGARGPLPGHGFARKLVWEHDDTRVVDDHAICVLRLADSEATRAIWPHAFRAELTVGISNGRLDIELEVENTGEAELSFQAALHTYLRVNEVEEVELEGLRGQRYRDPLKKTELIDSGVALTVSDELERIYLDTRKPLLLHERNRKLGIHSENMPDTVLWNPWEKRCAQLPDMPLNGFRRMLCVEAAVIDKPVRLLPQASWWGRQTLVALS